MCLLKKFAQKIYFISFYAREGNVKVGSLQNPISNFILDSFPLSRLWPEFAPPQYMRFHPMNISKPSSFSLCVLWTHCIYFLGFIEVSFFYPAYFLLFCVHVGNIQCDLPFCCTCTRCTRSSSLSLMINRFLGRDVITESCFIHGSTSTIIAPPLGQAKYIHR